jgi:sterol 3beta-glucosyltransferase
LQIKRKNANREEGHRRLNNVHDQRLMAALGAEDGLANTFSLAVGPNAVDVVIFTRQIDRKKMLKHLRHFLKRRYRARYEVLVKADNSKKFTARQAADLFPAACAAVSTSSGATPTNSSGSSGCAVVDSTREPRVTLSTRVTLSGIVEIQLSTPDESVDLESYSCGQNGAQETQEALVVPGMNVCLGTIGTWNNSVKQFVALGIKLKEQGHRVRVAANERFRTEIVARGLEFYPLAGAPESVQDFARFVYESQKAAREAVLGRLGTGAIQAFK